MIQNVQRWQILQKEQSSSKNLKQIKSHNIHHKSEDKLQTTHLMTIMSQFVHQWVAAMFPSSTKILYLRK